MRHLCCVVLCLSGAVAVAGPEVKIDCPAGTSFVKDKGCVAKIANPECPGGTRFDGSKCVAIVDTSCPAGMHFVAGTGCVKGAPAAAAPAPTPAPAPEKKKKGGTFSGGAFSDKLRTTCAGIEFDVYGAARFTGVHAMLLADGERLGREEDVDVGQTKHIEGKVGGKAVDLRVQQGMWGTRYTLSVDGVECRLTK